MNDKHLYQGTFNWQGESVVLHGWFKSRNHAFFVFTARIAKKVEVDRRTVYYYFSSQTRDGYLIEKVKDNDKEE